KSSLDLVPGAADHGVAAPLPPWQRLRDSSRYRPPPDRPCPGLPRARSRPRPARPRPTPPTPRKGASMSMSIRRGTTPTAPPRRSRPPGRPAPPGRTGGRRATPGTTRVLAAYLAGALLLLAGGFALRPAQGPAPAAPAWDYQRETVALEGGGAVNAYARWAVRATAWLARGSIERQRDVHRLSPPDYLAGEDGAAGLAAWRERHRLPLEGATLAAVTALAAWGTLRRRPGRRWLVVLLLVVGATVLVPRPVAAPPLAGGAGPAVPNQLLRAAATADPGVPVGAGGSGAEAVQR